MLILPVTHNKCKGDDFESPHLVIHPQRSQSKFPFSRPSCINPVLFTWALNNAWCRTTPHPPKAFHYINLLQVGHHSTLAASVTARGKARGLRCTTGRAVPSQYAEDDCARFKAQMGFSKHFQVNLTHENTPLWVRGRSNQGDLHKRNLKAWRL